jgi:hypothetical protein
MRQTTFVAICCFCLIGLTACGQVGKQAPQETAASSSNANQPAASTNSPPADVVRASVPDVEIAAGGSAEASVRLAIADGYHINANPPSFAYLKATELEVEPGEGVTAGKPVYPASITKRFSFSEKPLAVYEGAAEIRLPLNAASTASKGARALRAKLRIQACDDQACYPPRVIETSIPVTVR